jgi:GABA(A) receptor-associated protein
MSFKELHVFEKRKSESERILKKYTDRIPIIVEKHQGSNIEELKNKKFLVPRDLTLGQFIYVIRQRVEIKPEDGIYLFVKNTIPPNFKLVSEIYNEFKDDDGFLYVVYSSESTFGQK